MKQLFSFHGTYSRKQFWLTQLGILIASIAIAIVIMTVATANDNPELILWLYVMVIPTSWIAWAAAAKRCRDFGQSAYFALTLLIPILSTIFFFYIGLKKSKSYPVPMTVER